MAEVLDILEDDINEFSNQLGKQNIDPFEEKLPESDQIVIRCSLTLKRRLNAEIKLFFFPTGICLICFNHVITFFKCQLFRIRLS